MNDLPPANQSAAPGATGPERPRPPQKPVLLVLQASLWPALETRLSGLARCSGMSSGDVAAKLLDHVLQKEPAWSEMRLLNMFSPPPEAPLLANDRGKRPRRTRVPITLEVNEALLRFADLAGLTCPEIAADLAQRGPDSVLEPVTQALAELHEARRHDLLHPPAKGQLAPPENPASSEP